MKVTRKKKRNRPSHKETRYSQKWVFRDKHTPMESTIKWFWSTQSDSIDETDEGINEEREDEVNIGDEDNEITTVV